MKLVTKKLFLALVLANTVTFAPVGLMPSGFAQQTQATMTGQVTDPSGATLAGAQVTITNVDTGINRVVETSSSGRYNVTNLNPGHYSLSVKMSGFTEKVLKGITLEVAQNGQQDVALSLGAATDVVTVNASAAITETEDSSQGGVIDNQKVVGLPLNQRTFYSLALLEPAAYMPGQSSTLGFRGGFNVAGNNETANTFTVNGIDDNDQNVMAPSFRPSVETIQEFKLLTGVYSAEYGRTSGGQVVVITKTGTNAFHGDVFEFIRNSQFDAKNYFTQPGTPTTFRRNQFGATIGGPIRKDKTFFFFGYEGLRLAQPTVIGGTVPNPAMLNGDFSSVSQQLYRILPPDGTTPYYLRGNPYLNNQIPLSDFSQRGLALLKFYPQPDAGQNLAQLATPSYTLNEERIENIDQYSARVDHKISDKDSLLVQYNYFNDPTFEPSNSLCSSAQIPGFGCTVNQISTLAGVNEIHVFSEHWLNEFRFGYDRLEQPRIGEDFNKTFPAVPGAFNDASVSQVGTIPVTSVTGLSTIHPYGNLPQHRWDNHYNLVNNTTWSHGNHTIKFGINLLQARYSIVFVSNGTSNFAFTGPSASNNNVSTGSPIADLALGYASTSSRNTSAPRMHFFYTSTAGYIQDDWKATPHLTINMGVRYEYFSPTQDRANQFESYRLPTAPGLPGSDVVAGIGGYGSKIYNDDINNVGPRLGLSWQPYGNSKTVVHASYGIYYNSPAIGNGVNLGMANGAPFRLAQSFTSRTTATAQTQIQMDNSPFPFLGSAPDGSQSHPFTNTTFTGIDPNFATLYMNEYGADVQTELTPTMTLTVGYLGNQGVRLPRVIQPNQGIVTSSTATSVNSYYPLSTLADGTAVPLLGPVGALNYYYTLSPTGTAVSYYVSNGHSNFNAMTVKLQQHYHDGLTFNVAYTWSHSIDNAPGYASTSAASSGTPQDSRNLQGEKGTSDFNVGSRIVISPVYELPFGKNKSFLTHGIAAVLVGGWQLSGIYTYDTGRPFTISMPNNNRSGSGVGADRPNLIGNPNNGPKTVAKWFNTDAFTSNNFGQFGTAGRNIVIGPTYTDTDFAVQRMFDITERYHVSFRAEAFNVFNTPTFFNPLGTGTGQFGTARFGQLTTANDPRSMQFSAKVLF